MTELLRNFSRKTADSNVCPENRKVLFDKFVTEQLDFYRKADFECWGDDLATNINVSAMVLQR